MNDTAPTAKDVENAVKKVQSYKDNLKTRAEELIQKEFPLQIVKLNNLLETPEFCSTNLERLHCDLKIPVPDPQLLASLTGSGSDGPSLKKRKLGDGGILDGIDELQLPGSKVFILPNGPVPVNVKIVDIITKVKPLIRKLVDDANHLKMWISFLIPKIEDGNNFGVSIQEDTLAEVRAVESEAAAFYDQIARYYMTRGKIISKVAKYPHIDDYRKSVHELDEKEFLSLRLALWEVRNHYAMLHDMIGKNIDKIRKPRSINTESLY